MSIFYCAIHDKLEDSDFVGYYVLVGNEGEETEMCDEGHSNYLDSESGVCENCAAIGFRKLRNRCDFCLGIPW